jgi:hypothetical protein
VTRTWSAVDACGNPASLTGNINVTAPEIFPAPVTVECVDGAWPDWRDRPDNCDLGPVVTFVGDVRPVPGARPDHPDLSG